MAENLLDVGPPNSKRAKLNPPALLAADGPGEALELSDMVHIKHYYNPPVCGTILDAWMPCAMEPAFELALLPVMRFNDLF